MAVDTGYWPLFRYQPAAYKAHSDMAEGEEPARGVFTLDSKKLKPGLEEFLNRENRWAPGGRAFQNAAVSRSRMTI